MIIGYNITILRNNYTRTKSTLFRSLHLLLTSAPITEEEIKYIRLTLYCFHFTSLYRHNMYNRVQRTFCRFSQINRLHASCIQSCIAHIRRCLEFIIKRQIFVLSRLHKSISSNPCHPCTDSQYCDCSKCDFSCLFHMFISFKLLISTLV